MFSYIRYSDTLVLSSSSLFEDESYLMSSNSISCAQQNLISNNELSWHYLVCRLFQHAKGRYYYCIVANGAWTDVCSFEDAENISVNNLRFSSVAQKASRIEGTVVGYALTPMIFLSL